MASSSDTRRRSSLEKRTTLVEGCVNHRRPRIRAVRRMNPRPSLRGGRDRGRPCPKKIGDLRETQDGDPLQRIEDHLIKEVIVKGI